MLKTMQVDSKPIPIAETILVHAVIIATRNDVFEVFMA